MIYTEDLRFQRFKHIFFCTKAQTGREESSLQTTCKGSTFLSLSHKTDGDTEEGLGEEKQSGVLTNTGRFSNGNTHSWDQFIWDQVPRKLDKIGHIWSWDRDSNKLYCAQTLRAQHCPSGAEDTERTEEREEEA